MKKQKLNIDYLDFLPFEREQFEEYLNTLYLDKLHLVAEGSSIQCEDTSMRFYYRVAFFPKNKQEQESIKESYNKFGYDYIGQMNHFGIFESLENHPIFINEMIEEELLMPIVRRNWIRDVIGFPLALIGFLLFDLKFSQTLFLSNHTIIFILYSMISLVVLGLIYPRYYLGYLNRRVMNYSYRECMLRGYLFKFIMTLLILNDGFFMGTQSLIVAIVIPFLFIVIGIMICHCYKGNHLSQVYNYIMVFAICLNVFGSFLKDEFSKEPHIMSSNIVELNDYYLLEREETVFVDYAEYRKNDYFLEYAEVRYDVFKDCIFEKLIGENQIVSYDRMNGYDIGYSKDYIYVSKGQNILKTNIVIDAHEFVKKLNW